MLDDVSCPGRRMQDSARLGVPVSKPRFERFFVHEFWSSPQGPIPRRGACHLITTVGKSAGVSFMSSQDDPPSKTKNEQCQSLCGALAGDALAGDFLSTSFGQAFLSCANIWTRGPPVFDRSEGRAQAPNPARGPALRSTCRRCHRGGYAAAASRRRDVCANLGPI